MAITASHPYFETTEWQTFYRTNTDAFARNAKKQEILESLPTEKNMQFPDLMLAARIENQHIKSDLEQLIREFQLYVLYYQLFINNIESIPDESQKMKKLEKIWKKIRPFFEHGFSPKWWQKAFQKDKDISTVGRHVIILVYKMFCDIELNYGSLQSLPMTNVSQLFNMLEELMDTVITEGYGVKVSEDDFIKAQNAADSLLEDLDSAREVVVPRNRNRNRRKGNTSVQQQKITCDLAGDGEELSETSIISLPKNDHFEKKKIKNKDQEVKCSNFIQELERKYANMLQEKELINQNLQEENQKLTELVDFYQNSEVSVGQKDKDLEQTKLQVRKLQEENAILKPQWSSEAWLSGFNFDLNQFLRSICSTMSKNETFFNVFNEMCDLQKDITFGTAITILWAERVIDRETFTYLRDMISARNFGIHNYGRFQSLPVMQQRFVCEKASEARDALRLKYIG